MTVTLEAATADDVRTVVAAIEATGALPANVVGALIRVRDSLDPPLFGATLSDPSANTEGLSHGRRTEDAAKWRAFPHSGRGRYRVLAAIAGTVDGMTDQELEECLLMDRPTPGNRRSELVAGGWVRDSGRTRPTRAKNPAVVWVLTAEGRQAWRERRDVAP